MNAAILCWSGCRRGPGRVGPLRPSPAVIPLPGFFPAGLLAGISSQVRRSQDEWDVQLTEQHGDFETSGLKQASVIRCSWLVTHPAGIELPHLGFVSSATQRAVLQRIVHHLAFELDQLP